MIMHKNAKHNFHLYSISFLTKSLQNEKFVIHQFFNDGLLLLPINLGTTIIYYII